MNVEFLKEVCLIIFANNVYDTWSAWGYQLGVFFGKLKVLNFDSWGRLIGIKLDFEGNARTCENILSN